MTKKRVVTALGTPMQEFVDQFIANNGSDVDFIGDFLITLQRSLEDMLEELYRADDSVFTQKEYDNLYEQANELYNIGNSFKRISAQVLKREEDE